MKKIHTRIIFLISTVMVLIVVMEWSKHFLSYTHYVESQTWLFEGWLNAWEIEQGIEKAAAEDSAKIVVVGRYYKSADISNIEKEEVLQQDDGITLFTNSCIILKPEFIPEIDDVEQIEMTVVAKGGAAKGVSTHFTLAVNGEKINSFFVNHQLSSYSDTLLIDEGIQSICIYFDNDLATAKEGRYLIVESIQVGDEKIFLNAENSFVTRQLFSNFTGYGSSAQEIKNYMLDLGVESRKITSLEFNGDLRNRTLVAAQTFKRWSQSKNISAFTIISQPLHSRRSWMSYRKILSENTNVGVTYFSPDWKQNRQSLKPLKRYFHHLDELISYVGNWFFLTFFQKD